MMTKHDFIPFMKCLGAVCALFVLVFVFMFFLGAGFYFGAAAGGCLPKQGVLCENANLSPADCVITDITTAANGAK